MLADLQNYKFVLHKKDFDIYTSDLFVCFIKSSPLCSNILLSTDEIRNSIEQIPA
jgi:hypothetical protein